MIEKQVHFQLSFLFCQALAIVESLRSRNTKRSVKTFLWTPGFVWLFQWDAMESIVIDAVQDEEQPSSDSKSPAGDLAKDKNINNTEGAERALNGLEKLLGCRKKQKSNPSENKFRSSICNKTFTTKWHEMSCRDMKWYIMAIFIQM